MEREKKAGGFLATFVALNALAGTSVGLAKVVTSLFALSLKPSGLELSLISGAQQFGTLIMSIPLGILVDRFGPLKLFTVGSLMAGMLYCLTAFLFNPLLLILALLIISMSLPGRFVSMSAVFMQHLSRVGPAKAGWLRGSHMIGFFLLGPGLAVALIEAFRFRGAYGLIAGTFFVSALLAPLVMRHYDPGTVPAGIPLSWSELGRRFGFMFRDPELRRICMVESAGQAVGQFYVFFIIVISIKSYGFSPGAAAGLVTAQGSSYILALFSLGPLFSRLGIRRFYFAGFTLIVAALLILGSARLPHLLWLGGAALGFALGMLQTVNISRFADVGARAGRGSVAGVNAFVGPLGGLIGTTLGGLAGQYVGLQNVFLFMIPLFALFALLQFVHADTAVPAIGLASAE